MPSVSPTHQDLSNDTTFSQIKSRVPVPLRMRAFVIFPIIKTRAAKLHKTLINIYRYIYI